MLNCQLLMFVFICLGIQRQNSMISNMISEWFPPSSGTCSWATLLLLLLLLLLFYRNTSNNCTDENEDKIDDYTNSIHRFSWWFLSLMTMMPLIFENSSNIIQILIGKKSWSQSLTFWYIPEKNCWASPSTNCTVGWNVRLVAHWGLLLHFLHYIVPYEINSVKNICLHIFRCYEIIYTQYWLIFTG